MGNGIDAHERKGESHASPHGKPKQRANLKYKIYTFLTALLVFAGSAILNYFGSNPRILYFPAIAFWLWIGWVMISGVHTYVSRVEVKARPAAVTDDPPQPSTDSSTAEEPPPPMNPSPIPSPSPQSPPFNVNTGDGSIVTIDQKGGTNTVNNFGPKERKLSPQLRGILSDIFTKYGGRAMEVINPLMGNTEAGDFANAINSCRPGKQQSQMGICGQYGANSDGTIPNGVAIMVKDWKNPPPLAKALLNAFNSNNIFAWTAHSDTMEPDETRIDVLSAPVNELQ